MLEEIWWKFIKFFENGSDFEEILENNEIKTKILRSSEKTLKKSLGQSEDILDELSFIFVHFQ